MLSIPSVFARFAVSRIPDDALSVAVCETHHGSLRMDVTLSWPQLAESAVLEISVRKPERVFVVSEPQTGCVPEGANGWRIAEAHEMQRARSVCTPLLPDRSSGRFMTTAYLADFGEGYRNRVLFGDVIFRVVGATSRRRLLSRRQHIAAG